MRFDAIGEPEATADGTELLGSPNPGYWGRLSIIAAQDEDGSAFIIHTYTDTYCDEETDLHKGCAGGPRDACGIIKAAAY